MASGDNFIKSSTFSPPSNKTAKPGHWSRVIWLKRPNWKKERTYQSSSKTSARFQYILICSINKGKGQFDGFFFHFSAILNVNKRNGRKSSSIALWLWKSGQKSYGKIINDPRKKTKIYQNGFKSILKEHSHFCHSAFFMDHFFKTSILLQY